MSEQDCNELIEACKSVANSLKAWRDDFAGGDEHKRTVINTLINELLSPVHKTEGKDAVK